MNSGVRDSFRLTADIVLITGVGVYLYEKWYAWQHHASLCKVRAEVDRATTEFVKSLDALATSVEFAMTETLLQTVETAVRRESGQEDITRNDLVNLDVIQAQITRIIAFNLLQDELRSMKQRLDTLAKQYKRFGITVPVNVESITNMKEYYETSYGIDFDALTDEARSVLSSV